MVKRENKLKYIFKKKWKRSAAGIVDAAGKFIFFFRNFFRKKPSKVEKILVLRLDQMGDIIQTLPFFEKIKQKYPLAKITALVVEGNEFLLKGKADNVLTLPGSWFYSEKKLKGAALKDMVEKIYKEKYDIAYDLRGDIRNIVFMFFCGIKWNIGYANGGGGFLLDESIKYDRDMHEIAKNLNFIGETPAPEIYMNFETTKESVVKISGIIAQNKKTMVMHPFTRATSKMWGMVKYTELIKRIAEYNREMQIYIIGSKEDRELLPYIFGAQVHNMAGELTLDESIELIKKSSVFIGNDSGPQYFAAYSGVRACVIYGYTVNNKRWKPLVEKDRFIAFSKPVECGPCESAICVNKDKKHICMDIITVEEVFNAVKHWL